MDIKQKTITEDKEKIMNKKLIINLVDNCTSQDLATKETSWAKLLEAFKAPHHIGKLSLCDYLVADDKTKKAEKDGLAWIPCSIKDQLGRRVQENMDLASLMVLDIDDGLPLENIHSVLSKYEYAVHSSYSHSPSKPKWRVVLPLAEPIPASELPSLFDYMNGLFDGKLDAACGHDPARLYYLPACPADAEPLFVFEHHEGEWIDRSAFLSPVEMPSLPATVALPAKPSTHPKAKIDFEIGFPDGQRTLELTRRAGHCLALGATLEETKERCLKWNALNTPPLDEGKVISTVESIAKTHAKAEEELTSVIATMNKQYAWIKRHCLVYRFKYRDLVGPDKLRQELANTHVKALCKGKVKDMTHAEAWISSPARLGFEDLVFSPGNGTVVNGSINLWRGWGVEPKLGDVSLWQQLLDHIFNGDSEMRQWFECWAAYPIQNPGIKLNTAVVFWSSQQGVGKTLIGETVGKIYGRHFSVISATELHSSFNGWARDCQFVLGEENSSADHRADANKLKHLITGGTVFVNEKYQPALEMKNRVNFIFTSNNPDAFHLEQHDRRFFVWAITAPRMSNEFYSSFVNWRDSGGASALMHHLLSIDLSGFNPMANAPLTESKKEMIDISRSDVERWINETLDDDVSVKSVLGKEVATFDELYDAYHADHPHSRCNTTAMSRALRRKYRYAQRRVATHRGRKSLVSLTNHEKWHAKDNIDWAEEYRKPASSGLSLAAMLP